LPTSGKGIPGFRDTTAQRPENTVFATPWELGGSIITPARIGAGNSRVCRSRRKGSFLRPSLVGRAILSPPRRSHGLGSPGIDVFRYFRYFLVGPCFKKFFLGFFSSAKATIAAFMRIRLGRLPTLARLCKSQRNGRRQQQMPPVWKLAPGFEPVEPMTAAARAVPCDGERRRIH